MLRAKFSSEKMEKEENEEQRTVECLRGRLLAERQVSRSVKEEAELITRKMEVLEGVLKEEIRLREKAEKRLKFLMKKLELIKGSKSLEGSEKLSSSEVSCMSSSVSTSASKEEDEEEETHKDGLGSKLKDVSDGEGKVITSTTSHEEESQCDNNYPFKNQEIDKQDKNREAKVENKGVVEVLDD